VRLLVLLNFLKSQGANREMRAIDFFCGAGGLTRGLLDAGLKVIAGFDADGRCKETYERNNPGTRFFQADICRLTAANVWTVAGTCRTGDLLLVGCAPCQPFSQYRNGKSGGAPLGTDHQNHQATLLGAFARLVEAIRPGQVLIENVPGLTRVRGFSTYRRFLQMLYSADYSVAEEVLDAKHFGVPQNRRRYVLIAIRGRAASLPKKRFGLGVGAYLTVRHAIAHYPPIRAGEAHPLIPNHRASAISPLNLSRLACTPHDGGDRRAWPGELVLDCHRNNHNGHTDVYGRMAWDKPAPTLTARCHSISNGRYGHPEQDRAISLREAASLQTFRDSYVFYGSNEHIAAQIGNAVPVRFAEVLGRHIVSLRE
jgi:DNA (cytosine-5)-methyltransferase 1